jgi:hypothetical protein
VCTEAICFGVRSLVFTTNDDATFVQWEDATLVGEFSGCYGRASISVILSLMLSLRSETDLSLGSDMRRLSRCSSVFFRAATSSEVRGMRLKVSFL